LETTLGNTNDLFSLSIGDLVSKPNLYALIQMSKVKGSQYWAGEHSKIGNTPQQGINWVGEPPNVRAVIIKTRPGSYRDDGQSSHGADFFQYSFKAKKGEINYSEKANAVLIGQPKYDYPVLLFSDYGSSWRFEGAFSVSKKETRFVVLCKRGFPKWRALY
jgi:putative restriction endonuclease